MKTFDLNFKYKGAIIEGSVLPEEDYSGWTYEVALTHYLTFRIYCDDNGEWSLLRDSNALSPEVEPELVKKIIHVIQLRQSA
jgi:hypothetical protein